MACVQTLFNNRISPRRIIGLAACFCICTDSICKWGKYALTEDKEPCLFKEDTIVSISKWMLSYSRLLRLPQTTAVAVFANVGADIMLHSTNVHMAARWTGSAGEHCWGAQKLSSSSSSWLQIMNNRYYEVLCVCTHVGAHSRCCHLGELVKSAIAEHLSLIHI